SRDEAQAARAQAEESAAQSRESAARLSEQVVLIETNRQRLAMLEEQVRLEQLAAEDTESRVARARRALTDTERLLSELRDALAGAEREREETAQAQAVLAERCELMQTEETRLRESLVELEMSLGRLSGERVAALPRCTPSASGLLLPHDIEPPAGAARPADWLGGLRGLDLGSASGREFIERLGPLLDHHPDRRCLDEWARQGRTVFLLWNTPDEAGRLKQLLDVWGEIDPDGIAAIAPAFHRTTTLFAAPARVVRARQAVKAKVQATRRRRAAGRRGR
ncbi:MAG TPA: hypothetical protein VES36_04860, partial [Candidatus Limnocylindrales bacterium]|nr:hypothetical protein [Candidatus Limnocylindrales bacterium]